jgi:beta-glucosidase
MHKEYPLPPLYLTENGAALNDHLDPEGKVHDLPRIELLRDHLQQHSWAIGYEVDVRGYFAWSSMDKFERLHGYGSRFGLVPVDLETQERTIKDGARW